MDMYSQMREFADSWALLALFAVFLGVVAWAFRPGARALHRDIADVVFRHEDKPAPILAHTKPAPILAHTKPAPILAHTKPAPILAHTKPAPILAQMDGAEICAPSK